MKSGAGKLAYDPAMPAASMLEWRSAVRTKLLELMCFPSDNSFSSSPKLLWSQPRAGYRLEKWEAYPEQSSVVPFLVLVPDSCSPRTPAPAVMCFPGSTSSKELLAEEPELRPSQPPNRHPMRNTMALQYVQAGLVAAQPGPLPPGLTPLMVSVPHETWGTYSRGFDTQQVTSSAIFSRNVTCRLELQPPTNGRESRGWRVGRGAEWESRRCQQQSCKAFCRVDDAWAPLCRNIRVPEVVYL